MELVLIALYLMISIGAAMEAYILRPEEYQGAQAVFIAIIIGFIWPVLLGSAIAGAAE